MSKTSGYIRPALRLSALLKLLRHIRSSRSEIEAAGETP
jgi:hypothetical protein